MDLQNLLENLIKFVSFFVVFFLVVPFILVIMFKVSRNNERVIAEYEQLNKQLKQNGVLAPAVVILARSISTISARGSGFRKIDVSADVQPQDGKPAFRADFVIWSHGDIYHKLHAGTQIGAAGRKIWVVYNPDNPSQIILDHFDEEHEKALEYFMFVRKRNDYTDIVNESLRIRESGEEAMAVISAFEELGIETEDEKKEGKYLRVKLRVTSKSGSVFDSEAHAMISLKTIHKVAVGRQFHIKFNPQKPEISGLVRAVE